jgi:hypothetical protein
VAPISLRRDNNTTLRDATPLELQAIAFNAANRRDFERCLNCAPSSQRQSHSAHKKPARRLVVPSRLLTPEALAMLRRPDKPTTPLVNHKWRGAYLHPVWQPCGYCLALAEAKAWRIMALRDCADRLRWLA